jgi:hypothetical protein
MTSSIALFSGLTALAWLVIIVLLHVIKPDLDPRAHMISEYARAPRGWIMQVAFLCVTLSCWALVFGAWNVLPHPGLVLLVICGIGFAGVGVFVTDPVLITVGALTRSGKLHVLFAFIVIMLFPLTATLVGSGMSGNAAWASIHAWLPILSALTWLGLFGFIVASAWQRKRVQTPVGYFQRFMILTYTVWLMVVGFAAAPA